MYNQSLKIDECGYIFTSIDLPTELVKYVEESDYESIDKLFHKLTSKEGCLFKFLAQYEKFAEIEFIISLREAVNEWEEDGIWHDDGSRKLAFSLSIYNTDQTEGGVLEIRKKGEVESKKIPPFNYGEIVVFKTGTSGFEHKINQVTKGQRLIIAGWCS
jgi:hypothetical protein